MLSRIARSRGAFARRSVYFVRRMCAQAGKPKDKVEEAAKAAAEVPRAGSGPSVRAALRRGRVRGR